MRLPILSQKIMTNPNHDAGIPTLTEILVAEESVSTLPAPEAAIAPALLMKHPLDDTVGDATIPLLEIPAPASRFKDPTADEWKAMEHAVSDRVMTQVMSRIDGVLEQRLRERLAEILQTAMIGLSEEIRVGLQQTLEDVVAHAAAQEIAQRQK